MFCCSLCCYMIIYHCSFLFYWVMSTIFSQEPISKFWWVVTLTLRHRNLTESLQTDLQKQHHFQWRYFSEMTRKMMPYCQHSLFFLFKVRRAVTQKSNSCSLSLSVSSVTQMIALLLESQWVHYSMLSIVPAYSSFGTNLDLDDR